MNNTLTKRIIKSFYRCIIASIIILVYSNNTYAQRAPDNIKHENHYTVKTINNSDFQIVFSDAHSQKEFTQVKITITNKTKDYLYFKGTDAKFIYEFGSFSPQNGTFSKVDFFVDPLSSSTKTLKVVGADNFHVEELKVNLNCIYKISNNGNKISAPNFQLPASKNAFNTDQFNCSLLKEKQKTSETEAQFKCVYTGNKIGLVNQSKLSVKLKNGQEFANNNKKDNVEILLPNDECKIIAIFNIPGKIADMQFSILDINWNDTFVESEMTLLKLENIDFKFDPETTLLKNK